jgi:hypothetical protein
MPRRVSTERRNHINETKDENGTVSPRKVIRKQPPSQKYYFIINFLSFESKEENNNN